MPSFKTPEPISATVHLETGAVRIIAGDRADTVVEVRPADPSRDADVRAAERTDVTYAQGKLQVKGPRQRSLFSKGASIVVEIALPSGSEVQGSSPMADLTAQGALGECRFRTSAGTLIVEEAGPVRLDTGFGDVSVARATGSAEITTGSGVVRLDAVEGTAVIKNSNGEIKVGDCADSLKARSSNGAITIGRARGDISARTAVGAIRVGEAVRGTVNLETAAGDLEIGIREGTAAWLDVKSRVGALRNELGAADAPAGTEETVQVRGRTALGDITIRRA